MARINKNPVIGSTTANVIIADKLLEHLFGADDISFEDVINRIIRNNNEIRGEYSPGFRLQGQTYKINPTVKRWDIKASLHPTLVDEFTRLVDNNHRMFQIRKTIEKHIYALVRLCKTMADMLLLLPYSLHHIIKGLTPDGATLAASKLSAMQVVEFHDKYGNIDNLVKRQELLRLILR